MCERISFPNPPTPTLDYAVALTRLLQNRSTLRTLFLPHKASRGSVGLTARGRILAVIIHLAVLYGWLTWIRTKTCAFRERRATDCTIGQYCNGWLDTTRTCIHSFKDCCPTD